MNMTFIWKQIVDLKDSIAMMAIEELRKYDKPRADELLSFLMKIGRENGNSDPK